MSFVFATCERHRALEFMRKASPELADIQDDPETTGDFLDLVEADVIRMADPGFHTPGTVFPGKNYSDDRRDEILSAIKKSGIAHYPKS